MVNIYNYFISITVKSSRIGLYKFLCTSKLFCHILGSLYFIGLINLNILNIYFIYYLFNKKVKKWENTNLQRDLH